VSQFVAFQFNQKNMLNNCEGHSHYIDGHWIAGTGAPLPVIDPSNNSLLWQGTAATSDEVNRACVAATDRFADWSVTLLQERIAICERFADLLSEHTERLADLISSEVGKPIWEARQEVASMRNKVAISIEAYNVRTGTSRTVVADGVSVIAHRPRGVLAVLGPYNFPGHLPNGHIVPALLAANTIVFKPSEYAPQVAIATVALWEQAGLPAGVLNLINGSRETGMALAAHASIDGILFTGSYHTGATLHQKWAGRPEKLLVLEMGGNNPMIVWNTVKLDEAVHHAVVSAFISAGQRCTCARRIIVQDNLQGQAFIARLIDVASHLKIGAGKDLPEPFMGPVVSNKVAMSLLAAQSDLEARGGRILLPMRQLVPMTGLLSPGIIDVTDAKDVPDEEWFGPLLQIIRVADFTTALKHANATAYGLAASLLDDSAEHWQQFRTQVKAGVLNWNRPTTGAASSAPFGGIGRSGNHRPSAYYAADYCAYPVATIEAEQLTLPTQLCPGLSLE
jgi:succinylglutamic semialdehyde dehydrogenase